jgi:transposase
MGFGGLTDEKWRLIEALMDWQPICKERGTKRSDFRKIWNSILFILTTGSRWKDLPKNEMFVPRSSAHRWLKKWEEEGVLKKVMTGLIDKAVQEGMVDWERLVVDGTFSLGPRRRESSRIWMEGKRGNNPRAH